MKKPTSLKNGIAVILLLLSTQLFAQNFVPFTPRFNQDLRGDIVLIGNNILGPDNNAFNNNSVYNHNVDMRYIDIDGDPTTFSSTSADLDIPNPGCYRIIHAGLYWGSVTDGTAPITNVKFRGPTGAYNDIVGTVIFDANGTSVDSGDSFPYACYADVTSIVTGLVNNLGTYTVANVSSAEGETASFSPRNGTGYSAGWSLFVVYEDPTVPGKSITSFDGFSAISLAGGNPNLDIPISGFRTIPAPAPVRANFAFATLEGDKPILGDQLLLNGVRLSATDRLETNFFNSSVTQLSALPVNNRNPNSTNTLGFDTGVMVVPNPSNTVIANDATSATVRLETSGDTYFQYFFAFAVDIIEPNVVLTKIVEDPAGNDIGGQLVDLGDELNYVIGFQNTGNDDATNLIIRDVLPTNIVFNYPSDVDVLPPGVSVQSYNPATRELIFSVDNSAVEVNDPVQEIRFKVTVVSTCSLLTDACSNIISNQAFSTYNGTLNPAFTISDDPSFNTNTGCLLSPGATNFLADIDCTFEEEVILCGDSTVLTSGNGYDAYSWSNDPSGIPVLGTNQSLTVTTPGTYYVSNTAVAPCQSTNQVFNVITFGANVSNPLIPFADQVVICPNDGKQLPNFFLCGANDSRFIQTNITDTTSMIWERLDEASCTAMINPNCANEDTSCTWNQVATGSDFNMDSSGQYRLTLNYDGGCFNQFYFNVYTNLLNPTVTSRDIICTTIGEIMVGGVPSGYEYSIDGTNYQSSNVFAINTPGVYTVFTRQIGVSPNPCVFSVPDIQIRQRDFTVSEIITQPLCYGEQGSVSIAANDARPQYFFSISQGGTLVNSVGPIIESDYTFSNLNPGIYTIDVSTEDGCVYSGTVEIINPPILETTSALTQPLTCTDGEITVYPTGGTPPYFYFVNSSTDFQTIPTIPVSNSGTYNITVVDSNNCSAATTIEVDAILEPTFTVNTTNILCADTDNTGEVHVNVTNANGSTLRYSIDNGVTFENSSVFTALAAGNYDVVVEYTLGTSVCTTTPQSASISTVASVTGSATVTTPYTCLSNGEITVSGVSGGSAPYQYSLDGITFQSGTVFNNVTNGVYSVTIRDASGCTFITAPITVDALNPPTDLQFSSSPLSCPTITSDVTLTTTGGTGVLEYQIVAPASAVTAYQNSNIFSGLSPDTYTFQARDANGCTYSESYTIAPLPPLTVNSVITKDLDCSASPDGVISTTISGGTAPFVYAVAFNGGVYGSNISIVGTSFIHSATTDGTYQFQVSDANGCIVETGVQTINVITLPEINLTQTQSILCNGDNTGAFDITINNTVGTPSFTIEVINTTTATNYGTQTSGLPAGDYQVTITDSKSCSDVETITISEPNAINVVSNALPITCDILSGGISKGSVIVNSVTGGTAPYNYFVTGTNGYTASELNASGTTSTTFDVVDFGLYQINVVDSNGCSILIQDVLVASPPNDLDISINTTSDCTSGGEAVVSIGTALASTGPFFFDIYRGTIPPPPPGGTWVAEDTSGSQSATFSNLIPGVTYTFIVYDDSTGCSYYETATAPVPTNSTLTTSAFSSNNITCVGSADGNVSFTINSAYGVATNVNYEIYESLGFITTGVSATGVVPANGTLSVTDLGPLSFGTYFVLIEETTGPNAGCSIVTVPFNITESAIDLGITATSDDANCNPNSGVVTAVATNGTSPYLYQITTSATPPLATDPLWNSANVFNVDANTYYAHVQDAYGCIRTTSAIVVASEPEPVITAVTNNECTAIEGGFEIDVNLVTTGLAPYSYSVNGGAFQTRTVPFTISNLASGTHTVEVQDANGCGNLVSVVIEAPIQITPSVTVLPSCNDNDGEIELSTTGGSGNYSYAISPTAPSIAIAGNIFSGVPSGTYTITVTDITTLCTEDVIVVVQEAIQPMVTTQTTSVTCFGGANGSFEINVSGYSGAYTYQVFDSLGMPLTLAVAANTSTNPLLVSGIPAGNNSVEIIETASPFCTTSASVIIQSPQEALALVLTETSNVTCDDDKGTIAAVATGGWGTYEYELTGSVTVAYSSNGTFTGLSAGSYTVNVRDAGGCIVSESILLNLPNPIDATIVALPSTLSCFGDTNANITVNATGGQGANYTYTLNMVLPTISSSGPQTSSVFNNLGAGTYNVVVTDGYNCEFTSSDVVISEPTEIQSSLVKATSQTCTTQSTLTLSAIGGVGPYTYSDSPSFSTVLGTFASSVTFPVSDGTYRYYVRDTNGCSTNVSNDITIDPLPILTVNLDATNATINCAGDNTGVIIATAQGGLGGYVYILQDASGTDISPVPTQDSAGVFTNLPAGTYQVEVTSGDCLSTSSQVTIVDSSLPLDVSFNPIDVTCNGENDGVLEITASGGTGVLKYAISPQLDQFFDIADVEDLAPGNYDIVVQDELGCYITYNFDINQPPPIGFTYTVISEAPCEGETTASFTVDISGGEPPYSVSLDNLNYISLPSGVTTYTFNGLEGGEKMVYVLDSANCGGDSPFSVVLVEPVIINPITIIDYGCVNDSTINTNTVTNSVAVMVDSSIVDTSILEYSLDGGAFIVGNNVYENLSSGIHSIDVRHPNGCIQATDNDISFIIDDFQPLQLVLQDGSQLNQIEAVPSGGAQPYEYALNGSDFGSENTFTIYASGDYTVTVRDANGCEVSATRYFEFVDVCIPNYFTPNDDGTLDKWGPGCATQYKDLTFDIFDRYGRKIATLNVNDKWDGKYKGKELPTGDYWYVVKLNDKNYDREFVGHFTLYR